MGSTYCESHFCNEAKPKKTFPNWMSSLSNTTKLTDLTLPGTHNSCSLYGGAIAITQTWTIPLQLEAGIRYFDIRLRMYDNILYLQHGIMYQYGTFNQILDYFIDFLDKNNTEIIFMAVQKEYKDYNCTKTMEQLFEEYTKSYKNYIVNYEGKNITIENLRGKIFFINIFHKKVNLVPLYIVQNDYVVNFSDNIIDKKRKIKRLFNRSVTLINDGKIYVNYLSGVSDYGIITPKYCAYYTNKEVFKYKGRLGFVLLDFPGEDLIEYLIKQNFITDDINLLLINNKKEKIKIKNNDQVFIINLNTLKYLNIDNDNKLICSQKRFKFEIELKDKEKNNDIIDGDMIKLAVRNKEFVYEIKKLNKSEDNVIYHNDIILLGLYNEEGGKKFLCSDYFYKDPITKKQNVEFSQNLSTKDDEWIIKIS